MIGAFERHHLGITEACSPRDLGRLSQKFGASGFVGVKPGSTANERELFGINGGGPRQEHQGVQRAKFATFRARCGA